MASACTPVVASTRSGLAAAIASKLGVGEVTDLGDGGDLRGVVVVGRHADDLVAEAERERDLGVGRRERDDALRLGIDGDRPARVVGDGDRERGERCGRRGGLGRRGRLGRAADERDQRSGGEHQRRASAVVRFVRFVRGMHPPSNGAGKTRPAHDKTRRLVVRRRAGFGVCSGAVRGVVGRRGGADTASRPLSSKAASRITRQVS